jgi:hypothetical protein
MCQKAQINVNDFAKQNLCGISQGKPYKSIGPNSMLKYYTFLWYLYMKHINTSSNKLKKSQRM